MTDALERSSTVERTGGGSRRHPSIIAIVAALALAAGIGIGWVLRGEPVREGTVAVVTADGSELSAEQEQMRSMLERYVDELRGGDFEAAESWFSNDGGIRVVDGFDVAYGEFAAMLPDAPWAIDRMLGAALTYEDRIVFFHLDVHDTVRADVVRFGDFDSGEFHIEEHLVTD